MIYDNIITRNGKRMVTVRDYAIAHKKNISYIHRLILNRKLKSFTDPVSKWKFVIIDHETAVA